VPPLRQLAKPIADNVRQVAPDATAVGERGNGFELSIVAGWLPPDPGGDRHTAWVRQGWTDLRPSSTGVYSHFLSDEGAAGGRGRLRRAPQAPDRPQGPATTRPTCSA